MPSTQENNDFTKEIITQYPLDTAIEWINKNLEAEEVFSENKIKEAAQRLGLIDPTEIDIEEAYGKDALIEWAEENGYEKPGKFHMSSFKT